MNTIILAMNVNDFVKLLLIFSLLISCNDPNQLDIQCEDKIDSISQIERYKFIDIINDIENNKEIGKLSELKLKNDFLEGIRLNYIKHHKRKNVKNKFESTFLGEYYSQRKHNFKYKKIKIFEDSLQLILKNNSKKTLMYNIYYSYESKGNKFYKIRADQYFLNFSPPGIIFLKDNLCMDCKESIFTKL